MAGICLNLGAGDMPVAGYVSCDSQPYPGIEIVCRIPTERLPFEDGEVAHIYCGHMIEHLPPWDVLPTLEECYRVLAPGGTLTLVCPDADKARLFAESQRSTVAQYALTIHGARYDDMPHWGLWNHKRLQLALLMADFRIDNDYNWKDDERVYDRNVKAQAGARGIK